MKELKRLYQAATPDPWCGLTVSHPMTKADIAFICAARSWMPILIWIAEMAELVKDPEHEFINLQIGCLRHALMPLENSDEPM